MYTTYKQFVCNNEENNQATYQPNS